MIVVKPPLHVLWTVPAVLSVMIQQKYIPSTEVIAAASKSFVQDSKSLMHIVKLIQDQGMKPPL